MIPQAEIQDTLRQYGWKRLLLAVSGGLDSICLAHYFITNKEALGIEWIGIAHVHHGLREGTADRDAEFVQNFTIQSGIPFFLKKLDGSALKVSEGSLEENARNARYDALFQFASENRADAIATAHHAGDQAETMYLRLRRGVTLAGLHGIQQIRNQDERRATLVAPHSAIYRPFLNYTRDQLREYAKENQLSWREDESNNDTQFARNKIRHQLLPNLERIAPLATEQLCRIASVSDKVHCKIINKAEAIFSPALIAPENWPFEAALSPYQNVIALDEDKLQKIFCETLIDATESKQHGLHELFRLWLDSRGFRFPIGYLDSHDTHPSTLVSRLSSSTPPLSSLISRLSSKHYRSRFIEKCRHIVWFYDSSTTILAANFYLETVKSRFSPADGEWRSPQKDDSLWPLDEKIKARPLAQWLQEKSIPHWMRNFLKVFAQGNRVLYVAGIRQRSRNV